MIYKIITSTICCFLLTLSLLGQEVAGVFSYTSQDMEGNTLQHRILMDQEYFVETTFTISPPKFIKTVGGYYMKDGNQLAVSLEFNSNFVQDSIKKLTISKMSSWKEISKSELPLQGKWLMAGRVQESGESRRNLKSPRKTMKFLINGYFQWIAFNTETFQFSGSGGGKYIASNGKYTEQIEYFSRDNSKSGLQLTFDYTLNNNEWYHKGFSSKGDPMHEIWTPR